MVEAVEVEDKVSTDEEEEMGRGVLSIQMEYKHAAVEMGFSPAHWTANVCQSVFISFISYHAAVEMGFSPAHWTANVCQSVLCIKLRRPT